MYYRIHYMHMQCVLIVLYFPPLILNPSQCLSEKSVDDVMALSGR